MWHQWFNPNFMKPQEYECAKKTKIMTVFDNFFSSVSVPDPLCIHDQKALRFHQKNLNLCSEDEWRSYGFGSTWGWVFNYRILIFRWTIPLRQAKNKYKYIFLNCFGSLFSKCDAGGSLKIWKRTGWSAEKKKHELWRETSEVCDGMYHIYFW